MSDNKVMREVVVWFAVGVCFIAACTSRNPAACDSDADCTDPAKPFCDVKGEYSESHYTENSCSAVPAACPVERCGCTAGAVLSCDADAETVCGADGHSTTTASCALGCSAAEARCATFDPSNGLGPALSDAAMEPDVAFGGGVHINTDLGTITDTSNNVISVKSVLVPQTGGSMIRVFEGKSFTMDAVTVTGTYSIAFVSPGPIVVGGALDASGHGAQGGPGAQDATAACAGHSATETCSTLCSDTGPGGGGNATAGARGGQTGWPGGDALTAFTPLVGGCPGGNVVNGATIVHRGGGGGGAVQLVSSTDIALTTRGLINVAGGGGEDATGGGAAGNVVLEAPHVRIDGALTGISANGGSAGACGMPGVDGLTGILPAYGPRCSPYSAGDGGTGMTAPTHGEDCTQTCSLGLRPGGGGAAGRARIATKDGTFDQQSSPTLSALISMETLAVH